MEYNKRISAIAPGDEVEGYYILKSANPKVAANGKPFLTGALSDKTGTIELKVWDYPGPLGTGDEGKVVKVRGTAGEYRGTVQFTAGRIRLAAEDDPVDVAALVPTAPIDRTAAMDELRRWAASIEDGDYRAVAEEMLDAHGEALAAIPAAKSVHHAFLGGLLMHTANMMRIADFLAGMYPETIDRSLLLCGTLLHDMAKEREFVFSQLGLATDYSVKGQLLGHLVMGAQGGGGDGTAAGRTGGEIRAAAAPDPLPPRRAGVRCGGAAAVRRGGAAEPDRLGGQPDGDIPGDV